MKSIKNVSLQRAKIALAEQFILVREVCVQRAAGANLQFSKAWIREGHIQFNKTQTMAEGAIRVANGYVRTQTERFFSFQVFFGGLYLVGGDRVL